jgi:PAS domain S-box-containing protein
MPWVKELSDPQALKRCIRDLVTLSTLPAIWRSYNPRQIADSLAAALLPMISADVIYVVVPEVSDQLPLEVIRTANVISVETFGRIKKILRELSVGRRDKIAIVDDNPLGAGSLRITAVPIGFGSDAVIMAGSASPNFLTDAHRVLLGIAANNATIAIQRRHSEAEQRRLVILTERSSEFIGYTDGAGNLIHLNAAGFKLVGLSGMEEAKEYSFFDFINSGERTRVRQELLAIVRRGGRWSGEVNFSHFKTGEIIPLLVDWFSIADTHSCRPMNIAVVGRDLRERKKLEAELRKLNESLELRVALRTEELEDALKRLTFEASERVRAEAHAHALHLDLLHSSRVSMAGQMAGALAHELNQPLTAVTNSINAGRRLLVKRGLEPVDTLREILEEAADEALRASEIIRQLRKFVTRGETEMCIENLPILIREASELASSGASGHGAEVSLHFDPRAESVFGNRVQLQQVIMNLMRNAFEAMVQSQRRELDVTTNLLEDGMIEVIIADSGPGLPYEIAENLFQPFHTTKSNGMGLGLFICRSIIVSHRGALRYQSNPKGGTLFRMTLPVNAGRWIK